MTYPEMYTAVQITSGVAGPIDVDAPHLWVMLVISVGYMHARINWLSTRMLWIHVLPELILYSIGVLFERELLDMAAQEMHKSVSGVSGAPNQHNDNQIATLGVSPIN